MTNGDQASMGLAAEYGPDQIRVNSICPLLSGTGLFEAFVGVPYSEENIKQFVSAVCNRLGLNVSTQLTLI